MTYLKLHFCVKQTGHIPSPGCHQVLARALPRQGAAARGDRPPCGISFPRRGPPCGISFVGGRWSVTESGEAEEF